MKTQDLLSPWIINGFKKLSKCMLVLKIGLKQK